MIYAILDARRPQNSPKTVSILNSVAQKGVPPAPTSPISAPKAKVGTSQLFRVSEIEIMHHLLHIWA